MSSLQLVLMRSAPPAWMSRRGRGILIAKGGFTLDRLQTFFKGRKITIGGTAGEICAPLSVLLLALRMAGDVTGNEDRDCDRDRQSPQRRSAERRHFGDCSSSRSLVTFAATRMAGEPIVKSPPRLIRDAPRQGPEQWPRSSRPHCAGQKVGRLG